MLVGNTMGMTWIGVWFFIIQIVAAESPLKASPVNSQHRPEITSSDSYHAIDQSPQRGGLIAKRATTDSICGYVTSDIHWPWYCSPGQFCDTSGEHLRCCNSVSKFYVTSMTVTTYTSFDRNTLTKTSTATQTYSRPSYVYDGCAVQSQCFNSADAGKCSGSCNSTALLCTDKYFPFCASVYYASGNTTSGMGYMCDTTSWGMRLAYYGTWPSSTTTSIRYSNTTSSSSTWTPDIVPFSRTQAWRAQQALMTATATATSEATSSSVWSSRLAWMVTVLAFSFQLIS